VIDADRHGPGLVVGAGAAELDRRASLERIEKADFRARPERLLAVVPVRDKVDVVPERGRRIVIVALPFVDDADGVVELELAWREAERFLGLDERVGQVAARGERAGAAVRR